MVMEKPPGRGPWKSLKRGGFPLPEPIERGRGRTAVRLELVVQGRDLVLLVSGGEAHVGAVAVCQAPQGGVPAEPVLTVLPGHKEGPLARDCAIKLAPAAGCTCCAVVGIHQDQATPDEIAAIVENVRQGMDELVRLIDPGPD